MTHCIATELVKIQWSLQHESNEVDERYFDKICLRLGEMRKNHCTRVIQFPIPLQDKQGMKPRDTNNTDRILLCAFSRNFLRRYGYVATDIAFIFKQRLLLWYLK